MENSKSAAKNTILFELTAFINRCNEKITTLCVEKKMFENQIEGDQNFSLPRYAEIRECKKLFKRLVKTRLSHINACSSYYAL